MTIATREAFAALNKMFKVGCTAALAACRPQLWTDGCVMVGAGAHVPRKTHMRAVLFSASTIAAMPCT